MSGCPGFRMVSGGAGGGGREGAVQDLGFRLFDLGGFARAF